MVSQKCQYALRALIELGKRRGAGPVTVAQIAGAQAIPLRFLELTLNQLRQTGLVESRRGVQGGYLLVRAPKTVTVGSVIRAIDGPLVQIRRFEGENPDDPSAFTPGALYDLWRRAREAVEAVYDSATLQDLIDTEQLAAPARTDYSI